MLELRARAVLQIGVQKYQKPATGARNPTGWSLAGQQDRKNVIAHAPKGAKAPNSTNAQRISLSMGAVHPKVRRGFPPRQPTSERKTRYRLLNDLSDQMIVTPMTMHLVCSDKSTSPEE